MNPALWKPASRLFIFLPWPLFFNQSQNLLFDNSKIQIAFSHSSDCSSILGQDHGTSIATVAHSDAAKQKGLSGRDTQLQKNESMIFIYDLPQQLAFWMKETYIPLQIAYFDNSGALIDLFEMPIEKNPSHPNKVYPSSRPGTVALEMLPGTLKWNRSLILCAKFFTRSSN